MPRSCPTCRRSLRSRRNRRNNATTFTGADRTIGAGSVLTECAALANQHALPHPRCQRLLGRTSMLRRVALTLCLLAPLAAPALAQQVSPTLAELATYNGADRTERLIAGAKKE